MISLSYAFRIGQGTVSTIIFETCLALWKCLTNKVLCLPSEDDWQRIAKDFEVKWNFPNCLSAIDGKHVTIQVRIHCCYNKQKISLLKL